MAEFRVEHEKVDATMDGTLGGVADTGRRFVRGAPHYFVDDEEVTRDEFERRLWLDLAPQPGEKRRGNHG